MGSLSRNQDSSQTRAYDRLHSVVFRKTNEEYGGLSNMAKGFPIELNGLRILTSEALYQACRFPHMPEIQRVIIRQASPMTAKMKSKLHRGQSRTDWDQVKVKIMRWCLRVKLAQNWAAFSQLLLSTGDRPIVEESPRYDFWGAVAVDGQTLRGINALGRLLMELREDLRHKCRESLSVVEPLAIPHFHLAGRAISTILGGVERYDDSHGSLQVEAHVSMGSLQRIHACPSGVGGDQGSLFSGSEHIEPRTATRLGMTNKLKSYLAYKDSGIAWIGTVPDHWEIKPLKRWVRMNAAALPETTSPEREFRYVDIGTVGTGTLNKRPHRLRFGEAPSRARRVIRAGDTIVSTVRTYLKAVYFVDALADDLICSTGFAVLTPRSGTAPKYVSYLAQSDAFTGRVTADSVGTVYPAIAESRLGSFNIPVPSLPEQAAIARFLDYVDRRIQRYIRAKRKLISLLSEQKQALVHQAVTRGLDPNVRFKSSGVEWLGDIPEHWDERRAKFFFEEIDGRSNTGEEELLSVSHITGVSKRSEKNVTMFMAASYVGHKRCQPGDLVINTMWAWMGALGIAKQPGIVSPSYAVYRPIRRDVFVAEFANHLLRARPYISEYRGRSTGIRSSRLRLYPQQFLQIPLVQPPFEEQHQIAMAVSQGCLEVDEAITRTQREIDLIREYRIRLIADVVTGKLDVREVAANLPEEPDAPEPPADDENMLEDPEDDSPAEEPADED